MLIEPSDLYTHLYAEVVEEITRENDTIAEEAIIRASSEVSSYLHRFDAEGMMATESTATGQGLQHLKGLVKDVACWQLLMLANPNVQLGLFRSRYEDAIKFLEKVMKGWATPPGWPLRANNPATEGDEGLGLIEWTSERKRRQHY